MLTAGPAAGPGVPASGAPPGPDGTTGAGPSMTAAVVLAIAASVGYGVSDVLSGIAVRRRTASSVALWVQVVGLLGLVVLVLVLRPEPTVPAVAWGVAGGALGGVGVLAFYSALQNGPTSIVASIAGTGVLIPLVGGLLTGDDPGLAVLLGLAAVVVGVLVIAATGGDEPPAPAVRPARPPGTPGRSQPAPVHDGCRPFAYARPSLAAVLLAALSALCFGLFFVLVELATDATVPADGDGPDRGGPVLVALAVQVGALVVTGVAATRHTLHCLRPDVPLLRTAAGIAVLDTSADVALTFAISTGPLSVVGPLASLDPVVTVVVAAAVLRERIHRWEAVGVVLALAGIALVSS